MWLSKWGISPAGCFTFDWQLLTCCWVQGLTTVCRGGPLTAPHLKQKAQRVAIYSRAGPPPLLSFPLSAFHCLLLPSFTPLLPLFHCFLSSHLPSASVLPPSSCCLVASVLLIHPSPPLPPTPPPPFILGSPTVVMRCFIICISQLLIEREFRLSPGSSVRELPWET